MNQSAAALAVLSLFWTATVPAQGLDEAELALAYGDKEFVMIATGSRTPIARAPSVASVITAEDIKAMGATDLMQVLEGVPGVHISVFGGLWLPIVSIRGIHTQYNPEVLMLVNGVPITSGFVGDRGRMWGGFPLEHVARIEVIRGPGSALYGAEAVSGVINIITRSAGEIDGTEYGGRAGSFQTHDAWVQHGGKWGGVEVAAYLRLGATDGFDGFIARDAAGRSGPVDVGYDAIDARLDLSSGNWRLRTGYRGRQDLGLGSGVADALDPDGRADGGNFDADLAWRDVNFAQDWDVGARLSYAHLAEQVNDLHLTPVGVVLPDGLIARPEHWERQAHLDLTAFYTGFEKHKLHLGAGLHHDDLYKVTERKNFNTAFACIFADCRVVDVTNDPALRFLAPHSRHSWHAYAQDEWSFAPDWHLTAGVRHDHYSDFGGTTNPRVALVWDAAYDLTAKLMYGSAFRAPSFVELYTVNNPVALGNTNLRPETLDMLELAFAWQPRPSLKTGLSLFRYRLDDMIRFTPNPVPTPGNTARNAGGQRGHGLELEFTWDTAARLRLSGNYAWQSSTDETTGQDAGLAPQHHVFLRADWRFRSGWTLGGQLNWVADRERQAGDNRPPIDDYATVDLTLRTDTLRKGWEVAALVRNLFDADAREPTPVDVTGSSNIPGDLPLPGRGVYLELRHRL